MSRLKRLISSSDTEAQRLGKYTEALLDPLEADVRRQVVAGAGDTSAVSEDKWRRAVTERLANVQQSIASGAPQFIHYQDVPATVWTIAHNLGGYPVVSVVDSANRVGLGEVTYLDINTLTVAFSAGFSGRAYLVV